MKLSFSLFLLLIFFSIKGWAQPGCTDPCANNYNLFATQDDGSCTYTLNSVTNLPGSLAENSGLVFSNGDLWTHNDGGNANEIYRIDPATGNILQTVTILNGTNATTGSVTTTEDWEDIAASPTHLYIGDFGNNNGNRENLKVYKVLLSSIGAGANVSVTADVISFSYPDQGMPPFTASPQNHNFDCEAMIYQNGSLHLFTKNWADNQTKHYTLMDVAGTQTAVLQSTYNFNGLVTGADIAANGTVALLGNNTNIFNPMVLMVYLGSYPGSSFFQGNARTMTLGSSITFGQVEGIAFLSETQVLISTEAVNISFPPINISQQVYSLSICPGIILAVSQEENQPEQSLPIIKVYPNPASDFVNIYSPFEGKMILIDQTGRKKGEFSIEKGKNHINFDQKISSGSYFITIMGNLGEKHVDFLWISPK